MHELLEGGESGKTDVAAPEGEERFAPEIDLEENKGGEFSAHDNDDPISIRLAMENSPRSSASTADDETSSPALGSFGQVQVWSALR